MLVFLAGSQAFSQEYKISKNSGKLILNLRHAVLTGYEGQELVFINQTTADRLDERSKGLKPLKPAGLEDNTGIGLHLNVNEADQVITVDMVDGVSRDLIEIKVPHGISLVTVNPGVNTALPSAFLREDQPITARSLKCVLEISNRGDVILENNTGPLNVITYQGNIEARFGPVIEGPISLITSSGYIDVTVPASLRATTDLTTGTGNFFAAEELNIIPIEDDRNQYNVMGKRIIGKINDGGLHLNLKSTRGDIYLRVAPGQ